MSYIWRRAERYGKVPYSKVGVRQTVSRGREEREDATNLILPIKITIKVPN